MNEQTMLKHKYYRLTLDNGVHVYLSCNSRDPRSKIDLCDISLSSGTTNEAIDIDALDYDEKQAVKKLFLFPTGPIFQTDKNPFGFIWAPYNKKKGVYENPTSPKWKFIKYVGRVLNTVDWIGELIRIRFNWIYNKVLRREME